MGHPASTTEGRTRTATNAYLVRQDINQTMIHPVASSPLRLFNGVFRGFLKRRGVNNFVDFLPPIFRFGNTQCARVFVAISAGSVRMLITSSHLVEDRGSLFPQREVIFFSVSVHKSSNAVCIGCSFHSIGY